MKARVVFLFLAFSALWLGLVVRAAYIQVLPNQKLSDLQRRQFETLVRLEPRRGDILDRMGKELAVSVPAFSLFADPSMIQHAGAVADRLSKVIGWGRQELRLKLSQKQKRFVWLARHLAPELKEKIQEFKIEGLGFVEEPKRIYPNEKLASTALGFVGDDGQGLEGLESKYDEELRGLETKINMRRDARGRPLLVNGQLFSERPDGSALELTLDRELQYDLETELSQAIQHWQAEQGFGIVLDPKTSEILALASLPQFDPNLPLQGSALHRRNRIVTDPFEVGSTLKIFTIAAGVRGNGLKPNAQFFCENGKMKIGNRIVKESDTKHSFGWLTVNEILQHSSNIGSTKIAFQLGDKRLSQTLVDFGFGARTGVDLPGESRGILPPLPWREHLLSNISFGHGIAATPLQLTNAYAAIANGGTLHKPYIVRRVIGPDGKELQSFGPQEIRTVLKESEARTLNYMLIGATGEQGTGRLARVPGFVVAGKTGTAQKVNAQGTGYIPGGYISSFAGYIPAQDPQFVIYIAIDSPKKGYYGGDVAAPVFANVANRAIRRGAVKPMALVESLKAESSKSKSLDRWFTGSNGVSDLKIGQRTSPKKSDLPLTIGDVTQPAADDSNRMPGVLGLSLREALDKLKSKDIQIEIQGSGRVVYSDPVQDDPLPIKSKVTLQLEIGHDSKTIQ